MNIRESIDFFVKDILENSCEDELDASSGLMVDAAFIIHKHIEM
jgi:hypothetical protein